LSKLGVMRKTRRGSIEPEVIQLQMQLQQQREKYRAAVGVMRLLLEKAGLSPEQQIDFIRQHGVDASGLPGPGHEPIPQLQDDEGEPYDEDEAADEALENQEEEQVEENAPDEAAADERGASSYPIGTMAAAPTEQMLHMPPAPQPNEPDPVSQAG
ncbi:MAG TPA: hypothetical protein VN541_15470, partial [Tepidisphaeraceae bacterium]|nr:hypothetical protein [Tepidisphaeraceae bacterium]